MTENQCRGKFHKLKKGRKEDKEKTRGTNQLGGRRGLSVSGTVIFDNPAGFASQCCQNIVHVGPSRQRKIAVLPESGEHAARNGSTVPFSKLCPLLLLLPLSLTLSAGASCSGGRNCSRRIGPASGCCSDGETPRASRLGWGLGSGSWLGLNGVGMGKIVGAVVALGFQILCEAVIIHVIHYGSLCALLVTCPLLLYTENLEAFINCSNTSLQFHSS